MNKPQIEIDLSDLSCPIIMVDDAELEFELVQRSYGRSERENPLMYFSNGPDFLNYLRAAHDNNEVLPALILMDINMPEMTGFQVLEEMRADFRFEDIPTVLMLSSSNDPLDMERSVTAGANGYFVKRYKPSEYTEFFNSLA